MRRRITLSQVSSLYPGVVLSTILPNGVEHFGVLTELHFLYGVHPTLISASKRRQAVVEEPPQQFALGAPIYAHGAWSDQPWEVTVDNARSQLGVPYRLDDRNCEHFVRFCHGLPQESPQLTRAVGAAIIGGAILWMLAA